MRQIMAGGGGGGGGGWGFFHVSMRQKMSQEHFATLPYLMKIAKAKKWDSF